MPEDRPRRTQKPSRKHRNKPSGWQVVAVQSISCVVVILIVLLFKMIGGSAFEQLRQSFNKSIMSNSLMATIAALLETPSEKSETGSSSGSASTVAGESAGDVDSTEPADNAADTSSGPTIRKPALRRLQRQAAKHPLQMICRTQQVAMI